MEILTKELMNDVLGVTVTDVKVTDEAIYYGVDTTDGELPRAINKYELMQRIIEMSFKRHYVSFGITYLGVEHCTVILYDEDGIEIDTFEEYLTMFEAVVKAYKWILNENKETK